MANTMTISVDIKDKSGNIVFSTPINKGSKKKFTLMKEDYITLKFSLAVPVVFSLGDGISYDDIGDYELITPYYPSSKSASEYGYELRLDAYYMKWKNKILKYSTDSSVSETAWNLTATIATHMNVILRNIKQYGYTYRGTDFSYVIDSTAIDKIGESLLVEYDSTNIIDALTKLCDESHWNCEWWVIGSVIYIGKCESGESVNLEIGNNVEKMERSDSEQQYATRYFCFGGTTNMPETYQKSLIFSVTDVSGRNIKDSNRELLLSYFSDSDKISTVKSVTNDTTLSETVSDTQAGHTSRINLNDILTGTWDIDLSGVVTNIRILNTVFKDVFEAKATLYYTEGGTQKSLIVETQSVYTNGASNINLAFTSKDKQIVLESDSSNCYLEIVFSVGYVAVSGLIPDITYTVNGGISFTYTRVVSAKATVTFKSGANKGLTLDSIYNGDLNDSVNSQSIKIPDGYTAAVGDTYTIDNILKPNVSASYFTQDGDLVVTNGVVTNRLMLPSGTPYIDTKENMTTEQIVERVLVFDDIYPRMHDEKITSVTSAQKDETDSNGTATGKKYPEYTINDSAITTFKNSYVKSGMTLGVTFMSGLLCGKTFNLSAQGQDGKTAFSAIVLRNDTYGRLLPDDVLYPKEGDEYVLVNYDTEFMSTTLLSSAENELLDESRKAIAKLSIDGSNYTTYLMSDTSKVLYDKGCFSVLPIGQKVKLINPAFFTSGRDSRIMGYELNLDIPYDTPVFEVGETYAYSRFGDLKSQIESVTFKGSSFITNNSGSSILNSDLTVGYSVGNLTVGTVFKAGTSLETILTKMLAKQLEAATLSSYISTGTELEVGTAKGTITYTTYKNNSGAMEKAYYDNNESNSLSFSEEDSSGKQTATRALSGYYTDSEVYNATVVFAANGDIAEKTLTDSLSVMVRRKWFAGMASSLSSIDSSKVRALDTNGFFTGADTYQFQAPQGWRYLIIAVPQGYTLSKWYDANNVVNELTTNAHYSKTTASVEGANSSASATYDIHTYYTDATNDAATFNFVIS